jgi:hypothetical protein
MAMTDEVARLLRETGAAHHDAFAAVNGDDPEWPLWYAEQLVQPLSDLTGFPFTKSELVYVLVLMNKEHTAKALDIDWAVYYAQYIVEHYGK